MAAKLAIRRRWSPDDIHSARVLCKKLRALVHLGRGLIPPKQRREWNERLANAARSLSVARDGTILTGWVEVAASLAKPEVARGIPAILKKLSADYPRRLPPGARGLVLETFGLAAREWSLKWGRIQKPPVEGKRRMARRVHEIAGEAIDDGAPSDWHTWRRRAKYAAYQLEWIALAKKKKPGTRYHQLRSLGSALGKYNDMHNLSTWLAGTRSKSLSTRYLIAWADAAGDGWRKKARETWEK